MSCDHVDLIVADVRGAVRFFRDALGLEPVVEEDMFAELDAGAIKIMLSPNEVDLGRTSGVVLHFKVDDVPAATDRVRGAGARVIREPTRMDWGWESALVSGPEGTTIGRYRPA